MTTEREGQPRTSRPSTPTQVLFLNHRRDPMEELVQRLRSHGYNVQATASIVETHRVLARINPGLVIINPLILQAASVEVELLEELQRPDNPVPVLVLVPHLQQFHCLAESSLPIRDFMVGPFDADELLHRIELALEQRKAHLRMHKRARHLESQVSIDFKTGLLSERHFKALLGVEFKRAQRHETPLSLLLVDVDNFKSINDSTDYAFGDEVLSRVAAQLHHTIRATDYAARFGGDEFVLLLPHTTTAEAVQTAIRVRKAIGGLQVEDRGFERTVTVSIGIGTFDGKSVSTPAELRRQANKALHESKRRGKNQVWLYSADEEAEAADGSDSGTGSSDPQPDK